MIENYTQGYKMEINVPSSNCCIKELKRPDNQIAISVGLEST